MVCANDLRKRYELYLPGLEVGRVQSALRIYLKMRVGIARSARQFLNLG